MSFGNIGRGRMRKNALRFAVLICGVLATMPAFAATCRNTGSFEQWRELFKKDALAQGI